MKNSSMDVFSQQIIQDPITLIRGGQTGTTTENLRVSLLLTVIFQNCPSVKAYDYHALEDGIFPHLSEVSL